jgi:diaminopimelate epimerase
VPHGVVELPELTFDCREALRQRAKALRYDPAFPKGANINFYTWVDEATVRVLTYERGEEDYTLACGTGCGSTACVLHARGQLPGGKLTCLCPGGTLEVSVTAQQDAITSLLLEGPAVVLQTYQLA